MEAFYEIGKDVADLRSRIEKLESKKCNCGHKHHHPSSITVKGIVDERSLPGDFVVRLDVTFGPGFSAQPLTRSEFIAKLREQANKQAVGFLKEMFEHYADHVQAAASAFPEGKYALNQPAPVHVLNAYYGCGSCTDCSVSHPGGDCATCVHDGVESCEPCG